MCTQKSGRIVVVLEVCGMVLCEYLGVWRFEMCPLGLSRGFMCIHNDMLEKCPCVQVYVLVYGYVRQCMYEFMGFGAVGNVHSGFPGCWDFHVWKYLGIVVVMFYSGNARMMNSVWGSVYI